MNSTANIDPQVNPQQPIQVKGAEKAKKEPPKFIEKVIDKVEDLLTKPVNNKPQVQQLGQNPSSPPKQAQNQVQPEQAQQQSQQTQVAGEVNEVALPKGTTITLPDGKTFETQTESTIKKGGES